MNTQTDLETVDYAGGQVAVDPGEGLDLVFYENLKSCLRYHHEDANLDSLVIHPTTKGFAHGVSADEIIELFWDRWNENNECDFEVPADLKAKIRSFLDDADQYTPVVYWADRTKRIRIPEESDS